MEIIVDTNAGEDDLFERISAKHPASRRARLDVGDVLVTHPENGSVVVERKSWADLAASLADRRYAEQKARQLAGVAADPSMTVVWLVVGQLPGWFADWPPGSPASAPAGRVEAAVISTAVGDGIPVLRALDGEAAAETVLALARKLGDNDLDGAQRAQRATAAGYAGLAVKKSSNADAATTWQAMLSTVRGISAAKAKILTDHFPGAAALTARVAALGTTKKAVKELATISVGENRRLGPAVASRLVEIFAAPTDA